MMRTFHRFLLTAAGIAILSGPVLAEAAGEKAAPTKTKGNLLGLLGAGDMAQAAADLRKAGEAFERFANALKAITPSITKALVEGSQNLASMGHAFDPLGLKTAFTIIREQNQRIYALQKAEIQRLKEECQRLRKERARRPRKTKKRKKGRK
jgi:hypothetical protein